jgi:hypothetical protein
MGLDMYLTKKTYIGNKFAKTESNPDGFKTLVEVSVPSLHHIKQERISEITESVGYWRKANHIHKWFVDNVQDGVDDCKEYYVDRSQLQELLNLCRLIDKDRSPEQAKELLPVQPGFFFGSTQYDEWYFEDVADTIKILEDVLKETDGNIYYQASW